ncbi:MAG: radical SAM protein [Candidatus Bathyarchaeota archaeon]|nr:MAG: radical SAM protein [Candidatus Bathyarchaeota archaeon]
MLFSFINPRPNTYNTMIDASPPLGILYIASFLHSYGIKVSVLDQAAEGFSMKKAVDWVMKEDPDILGISTLSRSSFVAPKIAEEVKKQNPNATIVFGNHHATFNATRLLKKYAYVDVIVRGEGEQTCLELANCVKEKQSFKKIRGITYRDRGRIVTNPDRPLIKNIDSLPFPDRSLLHVDYHNNTMGIIVSPKKFTSFLSSRGCVFKCRFCSCTSIARGIWRSRSIENMLEELHQITSEGHKQLMFVDDNFTLNPKRVIEFCQKIRKEKIDVEWICEGRVDQCSINMLHEMVKAGCRMIYFGIESANQKVLDYYNKGTTPQQSEKAVAKARKAGVDVIVGSFIIGAPNETIKDVQKTLDFTTRLDIDIPQINLLEANPGTILWEELRHKELLNEEEYWETGAFVSDLIHNAVPCCELTQMIADFYTAFLNRPQYILKQMLLTMRSRYRLNIVLNNLGRFKTIAKNINSFTVTNAEKKK